MSASTVTLSRATSVEAEVLADQLIAVSLRLPVWERTPSPYETYLADLNAEATVLEIAERIAAGTFPAAA